MKLLFLTSRLPYPPHGGDKLRAFNFIKYLSKNHSVHLISFIEREEEIAYVEPMRKYCTSVETVLLKPIQSYVNCMLFSPTLTPFQVAYYRNGTMRDKINKAIADEKYDGIYIHLLRMAQYVKDSKEVNRILDLTDSLALSLKRSLKFRSHLFYLFYFMEWLKVSIYEPKIVRYFDDCLLVSDADLKAGSVLKNVHNISVVPNGVDLEYFKPPEAPHKPRKLVFIGNLHSFPNRDAVLYFYSEILPFVKLEMPDVEFYIVGANPPDKIKRLSDGKNVIVTGPVEDTRSHLSDAAAMVCPIRVATGMQNKILEAMAMGLPVISTSIATQWMPSREGGGIVVADSPLEFAKKAVEIMKDKELRRRLSIGSRSTAEDNYDWGKNIDKLEAMFTRGAKGS